MRKQAAQDTSELEAVEQREWRESLDYVIQQGDRGRVQRLLASLRHQARMAGVALPFTAVTAYVNSIFDPGRRRDADARQSGGRAPDQEPGALECDGDGRPR
jgi:pyruvate dehydrogenase complex dehydrogenase (E1) component